MLLKDSTEAAGAQPERETRLELKKRALLPRPFGNATLRPMQCKARSNEPSRSSGCYNRADVNSQQVGNWSPR